MTMNNRKTILATLLAALAATPLALAPLQTQAQAQAQHVYTQAELDQMLAPIALYPDALLSQVLMAATYPIEVVEAARWSRANPGLQGDDAVRAVQNEDWDSSVKSLVAFPQILLRMDEKLEWTRALGDAFLAQEPQVMDQVQQLRQRAQAAGNLRSDEQIRVEQQGPVIVVRPASPQYVYVPYYDPLEVYGTWWWPAYQPVVWAPWPGYVRHYYRPGISAGFWWGRPVGISLGFFFGDFDWGRRYVRVVHTQNYYYRGPRFATAGVDRGRWQHDTHHRRGVDYRQAEVRQRFATQQTERRESPRDGRRPDRRENVQAERAQPQPVAPQQRTERREERREDRNAERNADRNADRNTDQRNERNVDRRNERNVDRNPDRRSDRQAQDAQRQEQQAQRQAQQQAQRQALEGQRQAQQAQQRQAQEAQRNAQQQAQRQAQESQRQSRQEQRVNMPAAQAPQQPRAERQEQREQRREQREHRRDRDKG